MKDDTITVSLSTDDLGALAEQADAILTAACRSIEQINLEQACRLFPHFKTAVGLVYAASDVVGNIDKLAGKL